MRATVFTESGGWGLPTFDADGLAALALLRFADIPFTISSGASRSLTPADTLPVVIFEKDSSVPPSVCAGLPSLIALLTADLDLPDPNNHLTPFMVAESTAFTALVSSRFAPARLHELFLDDVNYAHIYSALVDQSHAFPLNRVLPYLRRREIRRSLEPVNADALEFNAGIALTALSTRLGDRSKFFYGEQPSVLDAVVFGNLASVLFIPLPQSALRAQLASFPNLVAFVNRIKAAYFATDGARIVGELDLAELEQERRDAADQQASNAADPDASRKASETPEEADRRRWNNYFIWGSVAAFAVHVLLGNEIELDLTD